MSVWTLSIHKQSKIHTFLPLLRTLMGPYKSICSSWSSLVVLIIFSSVKEDLTCLSLAQSPYTWDLSILFFGKPNIRSFDTNLLIVEKLVCLNLLCYSNKLTIMTLRQVSSNSRGYTMLTLYTVLCLFPLSTRLLLMTFVIVQSTTVNNT